MDQRSRRPLLEHTRQPWRIHLIANDFRVVDVWALPTPGGPDDFGRLVALFEDADPTDSSAVVAFLFAIRRRLGGWFGWDTPQRGLGGRVGSLRERLPADLPATNGDAAALPFRALYRTDAEAAYELANETVHGVAHLGWVPDGAGGHRGQLAILVKPNGLAGKAYLAAIAPFRHAVVYPAMLRHLATRWHETARQLDVAPDVRALSTLPRVDYADCFLVPTASDVTAEQWARAVLESAPDATRARLLAGWAALGLTESGDPRRCSGGGSADVATTSSCSGGSRASGCPVNSHSPSGTRVCSLRRSSATNAGRREPSGPRSCGHTCRWCVACWMTGPGGCPRIRAAARPPRERATTVARARGPWGRWVRAPDPGRACSCRAGPGRRSGLPCR